MDWNELYNFTPANDNQDLTQIFESGSQFIDHDEFEKVKEDGYANIADRPAPSYPESSAPILQIDRIRIR